MNSVISLRMKNFLLVLIPLFLIAIISYMMATNLRNYIKLRKRGVWTQEEIDDMKDVNTIAIAASPENEYVASNEQKYSDPTPRDYVYDERTSTVVFKVLKKGDIKDYNRYDDAYLLTPEMYIRDKRKKEDVELTYMIMMLTVLTGILICCVIGVANMKSVAPPPRVQQNKPTRGVREVKAELGKLVNELESLNK